MAGSSGGSSSGGSSGGSGGSSAIFSSGTGAAPAQAGSQVGPGTTWTCALRSSLLLRFVASIGSLSPALGQSHMRRHQGSTIRKLLQAVTNEPTFSPEMTRRILPDWFRLKMIIGRLLSLHRLTAVVSITFNPKRRISM